MNEPAASCWIGVDLGGTKMCGLAVDARGQVVAGPRERPTQRQRAPEAIVADLVRLVRCLGQGRHIEGVGAGIPTALDASGGLVASPNLPTLTGVPLPALLQDRLQVPVVVDNDANCFALGEARVGAAADAAVCCGVTLGTGFGLGIVIDGRPYRGAHRQAGEIWCAPLDRERRLEDVLSGAGVAARYAQRSGQTVDAEQVARRARQGDAAAVDVWRHFGQALGFALAYAVNLLDPDVVVLGGAMSAAQDLFGATMEAQVRRFAYDVATLRILPAALGRSAGARGAAHLALDLKR